MASRNESGDENDLFPDLFGIPCPRCCKEMRAIGAFDEHLLLIATRRIHHNAVTCAERVRRRRQLTGM